MVAVLSRPGFTVDALDGFCGYGGSSQGILAAGATLRVAFNHNELSLECHAENFPDVDHWQADVVDPKNPQFIDRKGRKVPGRYLDPAELPSARFAWFSPSCKHHTQSNATKLYERGRQELLFGDEEFDEVAYSNSERSRVSMSCVLRYAAKNRPEIIVVENVVEVAHWGPGRDGSTFRWWLSELKKLKYEYECCFFNSMFFPPCPQSRDRIYIVAWRKGNKKPDLDYRPVAYCASQACGGRIVHAIQTWKPRTKAWPLPRWGKYGANRQYVYTCPECRTEVEPAAWPAYTAIDWSNLGIPIWEREKYGLKPLARATMERIRRGMQKFRHYPPFIIPTKSVWGVDHPVTSPSATQTTQQDKALVSASVVQQRFDGPASDISQPVPTVTTQQSDLTLVSSVLVPQRNSTEPSPVNGQVNSLTSHGDMSLASFTLPVCGNTDDRMRARHVSDPTFTQQTTPKLAVASILPAAGNTYEHGTYLRARSIWEQFFTQHTSEAYGVALMPLIVGLRGGGGSENQKPVTEPTGAVTAGGMHHGLMTPFILNGQTNDSAKHPAEPAFTVKCDGVQQLTTPALFAKFNAGPDGTSWHHVSDPFNTVTTTDTHGLVFRPWIEQFLAGADSVHVTAQLATVMTHLRHALALTEELPQEPVTDEDLMAARFRMLEPDPELRFVMAFGAAYRLLGNKTQMTAGLGNAVTPPVAEWITERCLATLRGLAAY